MHPEKIVLDDHVISSIGWPDEPDYNRIEVGKNGITHINAIEQVLGDYSIIWIQVWSGPDLMSRFNARNVDSISYFQNESEEEHQEFEEDYE